MNTVHYGVERFDPYPQCGSDVEKHESVRYRSDFDDRVESGEWDNIRAIAATLSGVTCDWCIADTLREIQRDERSDASRYFTKLLTEKGA